MNERSMMSRSDQPESADVEAVKVVRTPKLNRALANYRYELSRFKGLTENDETGVTDREDFVAELKRRLTEASPDEWIRSLSHMYQMLHEPHWEFRSELLDESDTEQDTPPDMLEDAKKMLHARLSVFDGASSWNLIHEYCAVLRGQHQGQTDDPEADRVVNEFRDLEVTIETIQTVDDFLKKRSAIDNLMQGVAKKLRLL